MKKLYGNLYDQYGPCPVCGRLMRPVRYFTGVEGKTTNTGSRQINHGSRQYTQTFTSTHYSVIREHRLGFCEACDRAEFEFKEANWPKPGKAGLIGAVAGGGLIVVGAILLLAFFRMVDAPNALSAVAIGSMAVGLFTLIVALTNLLPQRHEYIRHQKGYRAPYVPKTEAQLSDIAKGWAKPYPSDGRTYWSLSEMQIMQKMNGNYFFQ